MTKGPQNATYKEKQRFNYEIVVCLCQVRLGHGQGLTASACWRMAGFCIICWAWAIMFGSDIIFCALLTHTHNVRHSTAWVSECRPGSRPRLRPQDRGAALPLPQPPRLPCMQLAQVTVDDEALVRTCS